MSTKKQSKIRPRLYISGIDNKAKAEFIEFSKVNGLTYHETFKRIWEDFNLKRPSFTKEEVELYQQASMIAGEEFLSLIKTSMMNTVTKIIQSTKPRLVSVSADTRVAEAVAEMMAHNDTAKHWSERTFINQNSIENYAWERKRLSSSNLSISVVVIKRFIENNKALLDTHHLKYGLDEAHNRKAFNYKRVESHKAKYNKKVPEKEAMIETLEKKLSNTQTKQPDDNKDIKNKASKSTSLKLSKAAVKPFKKTVKVLKQETKLNKEAK